MTALNLGVFSLAHALISLSLSSESSIEPGTEIQTEDIR